MTANSPMMSRFASAMDPDPVGRTSLEALHLEISSDRWRDEVQRLRGYLESGDKDRYDRSKRGLCAITPAGTFSRRARDAMLEHSGLVVIDLDGLTEAEATRARDQLGGDPHVPLAFISPSGRGVKALVAVTVAGDEPVTAELHRDVLWPAAAELVARATGCEVDPSGKDASRLCFVSWDPDACYRPDAEPLLVSPPPEPEPAPWQPRFVDAPASPHRRSGDPDVVHDPQASAQSVLRYAEDRVRSAPEGARNSTLYDMARLVGGYAPAVVDGAHVHLLDDAAWGTLASAAVANGLSDREAAGTAYRAYRVGQDAPIEMLTPEEARRRAPQCQCTLNGHLGCRGEHTHHRHYVDPHWQPTAALVTCCRKRPIVQQEIDGRRRRVIWVDCNSVACPACRHDPLLRWLERVRRALMDDTRVYRTVVPRAWSPALKMALHRAEVSWLRIEMDDDETIIYSDHPLETRGLSVAVLPRPVDNERSTSTDLGNSSRLQHLREVWHDLERAAKQRPRWRGAAGAGGAWRDCPPEEPDPTPSGRWKTLGVAARYDLEAIRGQLLSLGVSSSCGEIEWEGKQRTTLTWTCETPGGPDDRTVIAVVLTGCIWRRAG